VLAAQLEQTAIPLEDAVGKPKPLNLDLNEQLVTR